MLLLITERSIIMNKKQKISAVMTMALAITICAAAVPASAEDSVSGTVSVSAEENSVNNGEEKNGNEENTNVVNNNVQNNPNAISLYAASQSGSGWEFDDATGTLTVTSNTGTTNWKNNIMDKNSINKLVIESEVTEIESYAFYDCEKLESITIPTSVEIIGERAFYECKGLKTAVIPEGVKIIGKYAFGDCKNLESITIPSTVETIGEYAFYNCTGLKTAFISEGVKTIAPGAFYGCESLESITIPSTVETIGNAAFSDCKELKTAVISEGVKTIDAGAFYGCASLESITIPKTVKTIGVSAFFDCFGLKSVTISEGVKTIGSSAFNNCKKLETITIPSTVEIIDVAAFQRCAGLKSVTISEGVKTIDAGAFHGCEKLESITISSTVETIGNIAFYGCKGLKTAVIPEGVKTIGKSAFFGCEKLETITIPSTVETIGDGAFADCNALKTAVISEGVKTIGGAFFDCEKLGSIIIPTSVETIGDKAFWNCIELKYAVIGKNVKTIGADAFKDCTSLETIYYYDSTPTDNFPTDCAQAKITENSDGTVTLEFTNIPTGATKVIIHDVGKTISKVVLPSGFEGIKVEHTDHFEDAGTVTVPATTDNEGEKVYKCTVGGEILRTEKLPKLDDTTTNPTNTTTGNSSFAPTPNSFTAPSINASVEIKNGKAVIRWDKIKNADSYVIYIEKNGKFVKLKETEKTSVTVKNLKAGKSYKFKIAYTINGRVSKNAQEILVSMSGIEKPIVTASSDENSVTLRWNKIEGAEAYAVYKVTDGKAKKLIETQKNGVKINGLESQTEYSYIVRVKINGEWSTMTKSDIVTVLTK